MWTIVNIRTGYYFDGFDENGNIMVATNDINHKRFTWKDITENIMLLLPEEWVVKVAD